MPLLSDDEFDKAMGSFDAQRQQQNAAAILEGVKTPPQAAASAVQIGKNLGMPPGFVLMNPEQNELLSRAKTVRDNTANSPVLQQWMAEHPINTALAQHETPALSGMEQTLADRGDNPVLNGILRSSQWLTDSMKTVGSAAAESVHSSAKALNLTIGGVPVLADKALGTNMSDWWFKNMVAPQEQAAEANVQPTDAPFDQKLIGSVTKLSTMLGGIMLTGGASAEAGIATQAPTAGKILASATEHAIKSMWFPATTDAINTGQKVYAATGDGAAALKAAEAQYVATTGMGLVPLSAQGGLLTRGATGFASGVLSGEASRQGMNMAMPSNMQTPFSWEDTFLSGVTGSLMGAVMGPHADNTNVANMAAAIRRARMADEAIDNHTAFDRASQLASTVEMRQSAPEQFKQLVQRFTEDGRVTDIYVEAHKLADALDKAGVNADQLRQTMPEVASQMKAALETQGTVRISPEDYLTHVAGGPVDNALRQEVRLNDPNAPTLGEATEHFKQQVDMMNTEAVDLAKQKRAEIYEFTKSLDNVRTLIQTELDNAKRFPGEVNKIYAGLQSGILGRVAAREGITPEQAHAKYGSALRSSIGGDVANANSFDYNASKGESYGQSGSGDGRVGAEQVLGTSISGKPATEGDFGRNTRIRGKQGPLTVYRGARDPLAAEHFAADALGKASGNPSSGLGVWATTGKGEAQRYADNAGGKVENFHYDLRNPKIIKAENIPAFDSVADAVKYREQLQKEGYDGLIVDARHLGKPEVHVVAFNPDQVIRPGEKFNQKTPPVADLIVQHNLSEANLLHAKKMGGIAVPSLAITKGAHPLTGFGDITLLGDKDMADPRGYAKTKVFGADIYSPRYPKFSYKLDSKGFDKAAKEFQPFAKEMGMYGSGIDFDELAQKGPEELKRNPAVMAKFLDDHGIKPSIVMREGMKPERLERLKKFGLDEYIDGTKDKFDLIHDPEFVGKVVDEAVDAYKAMGEDKRGGIIKKLQTDEEAQRNYARATADEIIRERSHRARPEADRYSTITKLEAQIKEAGLEKEFDQSNQQFVDNISKGEHIFQGWTNSGNKRYIPHTLDNVVKILKTELRGGESFNYGVGNLRAKFTPEFKSLEAIRKSKDRLISAEEFEKVRDEINGDFENLRSAISSDPDNLRMNSDTLTAVLADAPKLGLERAAKEYGVVLSEDNKQAAVDFLNKLRELPTAYFEAKILRPVDPTEFKGAVVPHDIGPEALQYLKDRGITDIRTYNRHDNEDRARAIGEFQHLFFQNSDIVRGNYAPSTRTISLLKDADLSTYIHETGHWALDIYSRIAAEGQSPEIKSDMDKILKWFGVESLEKWNSMSLDEQRPHHEQFARAFEQYLMEGKAPSQELSGPFARVRQWMLDIYKSVQALNVPLTAEVRGVFDRMLASEDAIHQAEAARVFEPFTEKPAGVTAEEWAQYQDLGKQATDDAIATMQARSARDMKWLSGAKSRALRDLQRQAKAQRDEIRAQVEKEVNEEPVYRLQDFIKANKLKGDQLDPELLAETFGFGSGEEAMRALADAQPRKEVIDGITDRRMLEEHGELSSPAAIEDAANEAVHNEARAKFMATGLKMLAKSPIPSHELVRGAEEAARNSINSLRVRDLNPRQYLAAETRSNKEAIKLAPKDPAGAVQAQRAALLNNRLVKTAYEAQALVKDALRYAKTFGNESKRGKIDLDIREQIDALLDRFDFRAMPKDDNAKKREQLAQWVDSQKAMGYTPVEHEDMLDPAVRMHYEDMTIGQLHALMDTIKSMEKIGRERKRVTIEGNKVSLDEAVQPMIDNFKARGEKFTDAQLAEHPRYGVDPVWRVTLDRVGSFMRTGRSEVLRWDYKGNKYDLHQLLGPFQKAFTERLFKAAYDYGDLMDRVSQIKKEGVERLGLDKEWQKSLDTVVANHNLLDNSLDVPAKRRLTRGDLIGMAMHVGNESNFDKLVQGMKWKPEDIWQALHDNLTEKDWRAAELMGRMAGAHWDEMVEMNRRLGNDTPEKVQPRPFDTKYGRMEGWYAPISYDPIRSRLGKRKAEEKAINPGDALFDRSYFRADTTTNGSLNARAHGYYDFIDLDLRPLEKRITDTARDLAYREALMDVHKIYSHRDFRAQFQRTFGPEEYKHLGDWLGRLVNSEAGDGDQSRLVAISSAFRRAMVTNGVAFRISTMIKHGGSAAFKSTGYFAGGGEKYFAARVAGMSTNYRTQVDEALAKFPEIRQRLRQQDRDFGLAIRSITDPESLHGKAERFGHAGVAWMDFFTAVPTAHAAYDWAITEGIPKRLGGTGKPMSEADAIAFASKVVREAHGSTNEASQSLLISNRSEAVKVLTTLHGFMNNAFGQNLDSLDKVLHAQGFGKPELLARTMMAQVVPAVMAGWATFGGPNDKQSWLGWAFHHIMGEFAGMLPMVREAWSVGVEGFDKAGLPPWMRALQDIVKVGKDAAKGEQVKQPIKDAGNAAGLLLPGLGQGGATAQFLYDTANGKQHPQTVGEWIRGVMSGKSKPHE